RREQPAAGFDQLRRRQRELLAVSEVTRHRNFLPDRGLTITPLRAQRPGDAQRRGHDERAHSPGSRVRDVREVLWVLWVLRVLRVLWVLRGRTNERTSRTREPAEPREPREPAEPGEPREPREPANLPTCDPSHR